MRDPRDIEADASAALGALTLYPLGGNASRSYEVLGVDVPDMARQLREDDGRLLELEWSSFEPVFDGFNRTEEACCPVCRQLADHDHADDCAMKVRCDQARARQEAQP